MVIIVKTDDHVHLLHKEPWSSHHLINQNDGSEKLFAF